MHEQQGTTASQYIRNCVTCGTDFNVPIGHKWGQACSGKCYRKNWSAKNPGRMNFLVKRWHERNPERSKEISARKRKKHYVPKVRDRRENITEHPSYRMLNAARQRAREQGFPFSITLDDIVVPEVCPYIGLPLIRGFGCQTRQSPSLDKIIPQLGYVPGNVQVVSMLANSMKRDATPEELVAFAKAILKQFDN